MGTTVYLGDCLEVIPRLGQFDFIFADPPFNIGHGYEGYVDSRPDFEPWCHRWVATCWRACRGVLALHGPDSLADIYLAAARRLGMRRIAWVNWHYRFGQCTRNNWVDARCHCIIYAKADSWCWQPEGVLVASDRAAKYGDKRVRGTARGGRRLPGTVWGVPSDGPYWGRVQGNSKERRRGHPNQLPEVYLERLLRAYTRPGMRVLDPFCGSGTTATVAAALGRSCCTVDVSPENVARARNRIKRGPVRVRAGG